MTLRLRFTGPDADLATEFCTRMWDPRHREGVPDAVFEFLEAAAVTALDIVLVLPSPDATLRRFIIEDAVPAVEAFRLDGSLNQLRCLPLAEPLNTQVMSLAEETRDALWLQTLSKARNEPRFQGRAAQERILRSLASIAAVAVDNQAQNTIDSPRAEFYMAGARDLRASEWLAFDSTTIPQQIWGVLGSAAYTVLTQLCTEMHPYGLFDLQVHHSASSQPRLSVSAIRIHYVDTVPESAEVFHFLTIQGLDPDAMRRLAELRWSEPELVQSWWVCALREISEVTDCEWSAGVAESSVLINSCYPFRDEEGRIRRPRGLGVELTETAD